MEADTGLVCQRPTIRRQVGDKVEMRAGQGRTDSGKSAQQGSTALDFELGADEQETRSIQRSRRGAGRRGARRIGKTRVMHRRLRCRFRTEFQFERPPARGTHAANFQATAATQDATEDAAPERQGREVVAGQLVGRVEVGDERAAVDDTTT